MRRNSLYRSCIILCIIGYIWVWYAAVRDYGSGIPKPFCVFKSVTGVPCPTCGSTRALRLLTEGNVTGSLFFNPVAAIAALLLLIVTALLIIDYLFGKQFLQTAYERLEQRLRNRWILLLVLFTGLLHWIWNITKGL